MLAKNLMNMKVNLKIRANIMNSLVRSRAVYGCQTWCVQQIQMQKLNAAYMSLLRRMTKGGFLRESLTHGVMSIEMKIYFEWQRLTRYKRLSTSNN